MPYTSVPGTSNTMTPSLSGLLSPGQSAFTPQAPITFGGSNPILSNAANQTFATSGMQTSTPAVTPSQTIQGLINPSTPLKSVSTDGQGGTTVTYHPPAPAATPAVDESGGTANPNYLDFQVPQSQTAAVAAPAASAQPSTIAPTTQQSLLTQIQGLIQQQDSQQQGLTAQEQALTSNFTNMNAGILSQPGEIGYQTGRQAQLQQTEQTGLSALEGQQAQLAAYEQPQLSALTSAAGQLTPQTVAPGQAVFNPGTGEYTNASSGGGTPQTAPSGIDQGSWDTYVQDFATGNFGAIPSSITGNANLAGQLQAAVQAQNPSYNYNTAVGGAQGQQALGAATGTGEAQALQQIPGWSAASTAAQGIATQITNFLSSNPQLNSSSANISNAISQWAAGQTSNTGYQTLQSALTEWTNTIAPVLGVGGDTTNLKTEIAQSLIAGTNQGQTLGTLLNNLGVTLATAKISNYASGAAGGGVVSTPALSSGSSTASGVYDW